MTKISLILGDIARLRVDAIVNAANSSLLGGGGVDGAIHRAAGPDLLAECRTLGGCPAGESRITKGYLLPAPYVIHTVGPVWKGGNAGESRTLAACYRSALSLAVQSGIQSVAFPGISTGVYGYPKKEAAETALVTVQKFIEDEPGLKEIIFVAYDRESYDIYSSLIP